MKNTRASHLRRQATAPIELLVFLVAYSVLIILILAVGATGPAIIAAKSGANHEAWNKYHDLTTTDKLSNISMGKLGLLLGPKSRLPSNGGLSAGRAECAPLRGVVPLIDKLPSAERRQILFLGSWDFREIRFEERSDHPRLTLTNKSHCFLTSKFDLDFATLIPQ